MAPTEQKDEELVVDARTFTKSEVQNMDEGEFEHAVQYARQQDTELGEQQVETLTKWRGRKAKAANEDVEE